MGQDVYDSRIRPAGINGTGQPHYKYSINQFSLGQILMSYPGKVKLVGSDETTFNIHLQTIPVF